MRSCGTAAFPCSESCRVHALNLPSGGVVPYESYDSRASAFEMMEGFLGLEDQDRLNGRLRFRESFVIL
jgi:hypothetical protein